MLSLNTGRSTVEMAAAAFQYASSKRRIKVLLPPALPAKQKKREKADMKNAKAHER